MKWSRVVRAGALLVAGIAVILCATSCNDSPEPSAETTADPVAPHGEQPGVEEIPGVEPPATPPPPTSGAPAPCAGWCAAEPYLSDALSLEAVALEDTGESERLQFIEELQLDSPPVAFERLAGYEWTSEEAAYAYELAASYATDE